MVPVIHTAFASYQAGDLANAERHCRQALAENDRLADGWLLLGVLADHARQPADAERFLRRAAELAPTDLRIWNTLGTVRDTAGDHDGAIAAYETALRIKPDYAAALHNLGEVFRTLGWHRRAAEQYRKALQSEPHLAPAHSNLLFSLHFDPQLSDADIWAEHRRWGEALAALAPPQPVHSNHADPDRPLVIGYISPDFREHAVSRFFEPLLAAQDRAQHKFFLYSECPIVDAVGERLRRHGDTWRIVRGQPAVAVAQQIRADGVDILIDLAGHTRDNRLDVMALRPAPVQMTFLGYPFPTGLPTIDYRITDEVLDPLDAPVRSGLGESLLRLPDGVCCFRPPENAPPVSPLPMLRNQHFTFGCHHPLTKLNLPLVKLWAEIATKVPTAKFLCVRNSWDGAVTREFRRLLTEAGLLPERVELRKSSIAPNDYLKTIAEMDLILDAVPFNGHTMTCEALWMGVPVLTLRGDRPAGRLSSSVLTALGLSEFIAETPEQYASQAIQCSNQPDRLSALRHSLRSSMKQVLGDGRRYARPLEGLFREAWRTWCRGEYLRGASAPLPGFAGRGDGIVASNETWNDLHARGCAVLENGDSDAAVELFRQASVLNPTAVPPRAMLAGILSDRCDLAGAAEHYSAALQAGSDAKVRIAAATVLPPIYDDTAQIAECRANLIARIEALHSDAVTLDPMRGPIPNLFHVAYQGENDRAIMQAFAKLYQPSAWAREPVTVRPAVDGRRRIGFVSQYLCNHTIGALNLGLVQHLDRKRFHVTVLAAAKNDDVTSKLFRQHADEYLELPAETAPAVRLIRGLGLDHVHFPDLGMSCVTLALAHARLAPRQSVSWGHPLTTGIATMDDFVSASVFESAHAQGHYTERLVTLAGLNTHYPRPTLERAFSREEFNLPADVHLYGCLQTLFKFHPDMDAPLKAILENNSAARLLLIDGRNRHWKERLLARWQRTMPGVLKQLIWLPSLDKGRFLGLTSLCDAMLDPLHFGGGNTTLEALAFGVPVVTRPTPYLRARLSAGFYQHIGVKDYIADSVEHFIRIAADIKSLKAAKSTLVQQADRLFQDAGSVAAWEDYFGS